MKKAKRKALNRIELESGPFQNFESIAQHCEINFKDYLNEKHLQIQALNRIELKSGPFQKI